MKIIETDQFKRAQVNPMAQPISTSNPVDMQQSPINNTQPVDAQPMDSIPGDYSMLDEAEAYDIMSEDNGSGISNDVPHLPRDIETEKTIASLAKLEDKYFGPLAGEVAPATNPQQPYNATTPAF